VHGASEEVSPIDVAINGARYAEVLNNSSRTAAASQRRLSNSIGSGVPDFNTFSNLGKEVFSELCQSVEYTLLSPHFTESFATSTSA